MEFVTITVCRPCADRCGRGRGYDEPNPDCDSPTAGAALGAVALFSTPVAGL